MSKTSKPSILKTVVFLILAAIAYLAIYFNIDQLNQFYISKGMIPAFCLLGTVIGIAFLYGTAISNVLSLIGLESDH
ncbi:MAG: citrate transporter [Desulfosporosinus sp. BRH_c37]|nr:MAG: citrate transporter [Desulfosporosinus sp. BRH_c37]